MCSSIFSCGFPFSQVGSYGLIWPMEVDDGIDNCHFRPGPYNSPHNFSCWHSLMLMQLEAKELRWHSMMQKTWIPEFTTSVQSLNCVWLFVSPWTATHQAVHHQLQSLPKHMSIELVMPSNQLILCHPLLLLPSIFPSIRVFSSESAFRIRWPKPTPHN